MKKRVALVWLRNELRLQDNILWDEALKQAENVIPVFCIDPDWFVKGELGFSKMGPRRLQFLLECLDDLKKGLNAIGGDLMVLVGKASDVLPEVAKEYEVDLVFAGKEVTSEEVMEENRVENALFKQGIPCSFLWQSTLFLPDELPFPIHRLPDIFTEFRKACERYCRIENPISAPAKLPFPSSIKPKPFPLISDFGFEVPTFTEKSAFPFPGGEQTAIKRLNYYIWESRLLKQYKETRNGLIGTNYSSKFSPWLALGCLSPRFIYHQIKTFERENGANDSTYWLFFELMWRDYFRFVAKKYGNKIFKPDGINGKYLHWKESLQNFEKWRKGQTGQDFVDANMRELLQTGFMSNRGRQNVASYLSKDLKINWTWGAAWFEHALLDYDPCSNWGNWAYVAGVGNDPREDRYFNVPGQAKRYDPDLAYRKLWLVD